MKDGAIPTIRLEVEGMKAAIVSAIGLHGSELGLHIESSIDKAIDGYDWDGEIAKAADEVIKDTLKHYFSFGIGRTLIHTVITDAMNEQLNKKDTNANPT